MAKITTQQKSGSVGPSTFQNGPYGLIERARVVPLNPKTLAQQTHRGIIAGVASKWRELTDEERAGWAVLGTQLPQPQAGQQTYVSFNATRASCGLPQVTAAPALPRLGILICTGLVVDDSSRVKLTQVSDTGDPDRFIVEACPPLSAGIQSFNKKFRWLVVVPGHGAPAADLDLTAAYTDRFGAPPASMRVVVRLTAMKGGLKGTSLVFRTLVAAHGG
jgi:hypothetical protein